MTKLTQQAAKVVGGVSSTPAVRPVRIGLMGLGQVGQAAARLCAATRGTLRERGVDPQIAGVLVRDAGKAREFTPREAVTTSDIDAFLVQPYDLVIEVMGGVRPAHDLVERCLRRGIPVVTANKSLMAAHGVDLFRTAAECGVTLRCEASAIAGVPFLAALRDRPLIARVQKLSGILNGTSNYILSSMEADGVAFDAALDDAKAKGYAEPDPTNDIESIDAAEKLVVILQHLGISGVRTSELEVVGIGGVEPHDFAQAGVLGGAIKPVASAALGDTHVEAFVGPAFVPHRHPLGGVRYERNGIFLQGPAIGELCFTGPGAGPEVTAATILDDCYQVIAEGAGGLPPVIARGGLVRRAAAPKTGWLLTVQFPEVRDAVDAEQAALALLAGVDVTTRRSVASVKDGRSVVHALSHPRRREAVLRATESLEQHGLELGAIRALD